MRRLLEAPGQWRNDLQRSAPKCIAHRGRAGATRCNRICLPINTAICCSALPRLQGVAGAGRATCRLREDYWTGKVIALELTAPHSQMQTRGRRLPGAVLRRP